MDDNIRKTKQDLCIQKWMELIEDFNNSDMTLSEWCDWITSVRQPIVNILD